MERGNQLGPRADERMKEDVSDGEPMPESVVSAAIAEPSAGLTHDEARARSELAIHLRPSIFPATRGEILACAEEEHAPTALQGQLAALPENTYENVEQVWEALGGRRDARGGEREASHARGTGRVVPARVAIGEPELSWPDSSAGRVRRFPFRFDWRYRLASAPFGVKDERAYVEVDTRRDEGRLRARFGPWLVDTPLDNVDAAITTGPYSVIKTIGPARLGLGDRGLTFATNPQRGLCICFREAVPGIDPRGIVKHPALTVTVDDVLGLRRALHEALQHNGA